MIVIVSVIWIIRLRFRFRFRFWFWLRFRFWFWAITNYNFNSSSLIRLAPWLFPMGSAAGGGVTIFHPADDSSTLRKQSNKTAGAWASLSRATPPNPDRKSVV